ncbi:asparaginase [Candidatus Puniceispirillum sp.]|jgi:L-asparaginase II|uniref:asparaginase n=1 Tax=Candidatus Puniceispirillum sp. TaxID=2026719 RepID=UPI001ECDF6AB|nr:asparaginase [Candidatus Puniceispirillum sp.]
MTQIITPRQTLPLHSDAPLIVNVNRNHTMESYHAVDIAVCDADGKVIIGLGDVERPIFPRSAMKPLQAIALAEKYVQGDMMPAIEDSEWSIICASHNGQPIHSAAVSQLLKKFNLEPSCLICGAHWSIERNAMVEQVQNLKAPERIHNNCSGKHSGMLVLAHLMGVTNEGYAAITHPVQQSIIGVLDAMTGVDILSFTHGFDGCGAPAVSAPLGNWARAFALFADHDQLPPHRAEACARITRGIASAPLLLAGERRLCSALATAFGASITAKTGAEGVYAAALHELGLGVMLKCRDGQTRAAEVALGAVLHAIGYDMPASLDPFFRPILRNWEGDEIGDITVDGGIMVSNA